MALIPEQFNKLVTKDEFNEFKDEMMDMKKDVRKILNSVDGIAKQHEDFKTELAANQGAHDRFEEKFIKTDKRIKAMEGKFNISPVAAQKICGQFFKILLS